MRTNEDPIEEGDTDLTKFLNSVAMVRRIHGDNLPGPTTRSTHSKIELPDVAPDIDKNTGFSISRLIQDTMSVAHFNLKDHVVKKNLNDRDGFPLKLPDSTKSRKIYKPYSTDYSLTNLELTQRWQT